jgi:hypothetical protein
MNVVYRCEVFERVNGELRPDGVVYTLHKPMMQFEYDRYKRIDHNVVFGDIKLAIVSPSLAKKIHNGDGAWSTTSGDDPGFLGLFTPRDPKANIDLYRSRDERTPEQAALAADMTATS